MTKNKAVLYGMIICFMLILPSLLPAVSQGALLFLTIEPGARANGMGRAYSAVVDDAYAGWWNPGALAFNRKTQLAGAHTPWLQGAGGDANDLFYEYLGWNQYFEGVGNLGMSIQWFDMGTQIQTNEDGIELGEFHSFDVAANVSYGYDVIPEKLGVGGSFKLVYSYLGPATGQTDTEGNAFAFAFDLGLKAKDVVVPNLDASVVLQNIGPNVTYVNDAQSDPLPMTFRTGLAYKVYDTPLNRFLLSVEASKILANEDALFARFASGWDPIDEMIYAAGAEYTYLDLISLRSGWFNDEAGSVTGPSFGVGFQYRFSQIYKITADFAMIAGGDLVDYNKSFSVGLEF